MAIALRYNTASQEVALGPFVDSVDGVTSETGLTISNTDIKLHKAGATSLANKNSGGATHMAGGVYYTVLDATDTDTVGPLVITVQESGALAVRVECEVLSQAYYDAKFGAALLPVNTTLIEGSDATDQLAAAASGSLVAADVAEALVAMNLGGTAQGGAAGSITLAAGASGSNDTYNGRVLSIVAGTGAGQAPRIITDYVGSTKVASVSPNWVVQPDATSVYLILH